MTHLTQEIVDAEVAEAKAMWDQLVKDSGQTEAMFIVSSSEARHFLWQYHEVKALVDGLGLVMPDLVKGATITINDKAHQ